MTMIIGGEGSIEKRASFTAGWIQAENNFKNLTFKCPVNLPFSDDLWIALGLNFQIRVVHCLDHV